MRLPTIVLGVIFPICIRAGSAHASCFFTDETLTAPTSLAKFKLGTMVALSIRLALATMKPQIIFALFLWLAIWVSADFKRRYRLLIPFLITVAILVVGADILLPHWISRFLQAAREYQTYTGAVPLLDELISVRGSRLLELAV